MLVEYNPGFCALLRDRYLDARIVQGDAYALRDSLWDVLKVPASAVVSGLPLVTKPMLTRLKLVRDAFAALAPGAPFVQFTYSVAPPISNRCPAFPPKPPNSLDGFFASPRPGVFARADPFPAPRRRFALSCDWFMAALKILVIPGSLRTGSHNAKLAAAAAHEFALAGAEVTRISLSDFPLPIYDGDLQNKSGVPKHAINLKRMMGAHYGVLLVSPEYNASVSPLLKNAIDWVSRVQDPHETRGQVFRERAFAVAAASQSRLGGTRGLAALRLILTAADAPVIPSQLALSFAAEAYEDMEQARYPADSRDWTRRRGSRSRASQRMMM